MRTPSPDTAVGLLSTGFYVPKDEVSNEEIAPRAGVDPEWIVRKTHIRTRRFAAPTEATSDLAAKAAQQALLNAGLRSSQVDYIIVSTGTGDHPQPPTAYLVQDALEATNAACFDINVACSGSVYGLELARGLLKQRPDAHVLLIAAEVYSRFADFDDPRSGVLLGDGAGAMVIARVPAPYGILGIDLISRGDAHPLIRIDAGGSRLPASHETVDAGDHCVRMYGRGVTEFVLEHVPPALAALTARCGVSLADVDHFVPHQPNGALLSRLEAASGLVSARTHRTVERFANMGSASAAVTLAAAAPEFRDGDLVLIAGFGGGMAIGCCLVRWAVTS